MATHARPPAGATGTAAGNFGLVGARIRLEGERTGALDLAAHAGRGTDAGSGSWFTGHLRGELSRRFGRISLGAGLSGFGLGYAGPFRYSAYGARLEPRASTFLNGILLRARGDLAIGRWHSTTVIEDGGFEPGPPFVPTIPDVEVDASGSLALAGAALEAGRAFGPLWVQVEALAYQAENGAVEGLHAGADATVALAAGRFTGSLGTRLRDTPLGSDIGYHAAIGTDLGSGIGLTLRIGRSVLDPLYGTPGSFAASVGMSWQMPSRTLGARPPLVELGAATAEGRRVRFHLHEPDARSAALAGDFTGWRPRPMRRDDGAWTLELVLGPGVHHFAFVLDGEHWTVPDDAPGIVADGWGRRNATIVIRVE